MIEAHNISKNFGCSSALTKINFAVEQGEFVSIIGPSGCGKSTLLKILAGIVCPDKGYITINSNTCNSKVDYLFQEPCLFPWFNVQQNIQLPQKITDQLNEDRVSTMLEMTGLKQHQHLLPHQLSGGMKQRVALARSLIQEPDILLMDEPFASLDEITRNRMGEELLKIWDKIRFTCLFVTHSISEAVFLADRVIVLSEQPGMIKMDIEIDLERPRTLEMKDTLEFTRYTKCIRQIIASR